MKAIRYAVPATGTRVWWRDSSGEEKSGTVSGRFNGSHARVQVEARWNVQDFTTGKLTECVGTRTIPVEINALSMRPFIQEGGSL